MAELQQLSQKLKNKTQKHTNFELIISSAQYSQFNTPEFLFITTQELQNKHKRQHKPNSFSIEGFLVQSTQTKFLV